MAAKVAKGLMLKNYRLKKLQDRYRFVRNMNKYLEESIDNFEAYKNDQKVLNYNLVVDEIAFIKMV